MPFPTTPILDDFNRADGAPGANWGAAIATYALPNIASNQLDFPQYPSGYWTTSFAADQEAYVQNSGAATSISLLLRLTNPNSGAETCYVVQGGMGNANLAALSIDKKVGGTLTNLFFANAVMAATDTWLGVSVIGTTMIVYGSSDGVTWNDRKTFVDSAVTGGGFVGVYHANNPTASSIDNFGGGPASVDRLNLFKAIPFFKLGKAA